MGLLESAIMSICIGSSGATNQACTNAVTAGGKQTGIVQSTNAYEDRQVHLIEKNAKDFLGKDTVDVVGGTAWLTKSLVEKKASFGLPNLGICTKVVAEVNSNEARLIFRWIF